MKSPVFNFMGIVKNRDREDMQFIVKWENREMAIVFDKKDFNADTPLLVINLFNDGLNEIFNGAGFPKGNYNYGDNFLNP